MTPRLMLAAASSGSGKTTIACAILQALTRMGEHPVSFKCGPDYIDPMFHRQVLGVPSRNLDLFFSDEATAAYLLQKNSENFSLAFIEGVMGYYDGIATTTEASSWQLAKATQTPVVLVLNCKGMSVSIAAQLGGYLSYQPDSQIKGVILNQVSKSIYPEIKALIEQRYDVAVCGYMPKMSDCSLESRHLGLVTAEEIGDLQQRLEKLGEQAMQTIDLPLLLKIAAQAPALAVPAVQLPAPNPTPLRIGVARDKAFSFYYADNLELLEQLGAQLVEFSPLHDPQLPDDLDGLLLSVRLSRAVRRHPQPKPHADGTDKSRAAKWLALHCRMRRLSVPLRAAGGRRFQILPDGRLSAGQQLSHPVPAQVWLCSPDRAEGQPAVQKRGGLCRPRIPLLGQPELRQRLHCTKTLPAQQLGVRGL